jgi:2-C-methyl-D-erythritol 4-phosphate cytidylyltransferase
VLSRPEPERALRLFEQARRVCDAAHGVSDVRQARIALESACALLRLDRFDEVIAVTEATWPVLAAHGQDERLAALYTIQSEALAVAEPGSTRATSVAQLAAEWSAYALGSDRRAATCRRKV